MTTLTASLPSRIIHRAQAVVTAEVGSVCVVIWRGSVTKTPFELQRAALAQVVQRHPTGAGFLCVVEIHAKPPESELRRASSEMVLTHGDRLKCVACVMEGEGFLAAINRGALASMVLLLRNRKAPVSVFARVTDATDWMRQYLVVPKTQDFSAVVERIRSELPPPENPF